MNAAQVSGSLFDYAISVYKMSFCSIIFQGKSFGYQKRKKTKKKKNSSKQGNVKYFTAHVVI
jgi:hypothetical protein